MKARLGRIRAEQVREGHTIWVDGALRKVTYATGVTQIARDGVTHEVATINYHYRGGFRHRDFRIGARLRVVVESPYGR